MLQKTRAIVIKTFPYKESSFISVLYTEHFGLKSYIINGGRRKNGYKYALFQPLQILDIIFNENNKQSLQKLKECSCPYDLTSIREDIIKVSLVFFISEVLQNTIKESEKNSLLFTFLQITILDIKHFNNDVLKDYHLYFLYHLTKFLGFEPMNNYSDKENIYFDINTGFFTDKQDITTLDKYNSKALHYLINKFKNTYCPITNNFKERTNLLHSLLSFYYQHIIIDKKLFSVNIFNDIFH